MDALVPLSKESPITNTLCVFLVALVLRRVGGWITFAQLASPGSSLLLTCSSFSNTRALCRGSSEDGGRFFLLPAAETRVQSPPSHELLVSVSSSTLPFTALRQGCHSALGQWTISCINLLFTFLDIVLPVELLLLFNVVKPRCLKCTYCVLTKCSLQSMMQLFPY